MRGYLISWLAKHTTSDHLEGFLAERPDDVLVWEAGPWRPTYQARETLAQEGERHSPPHGAGESLAIVLHQDPGQPYVALGRGTDNDIVIDDATLSRLHLLFTHDATGWTVRDAGSTNGTLVEGARLGPDPVALLPGTKIVAGSVRLTFYDSGGLFLRLKGVH